MAKDKLNKIRIQFIVEWPKDLFKTFGIPLKKLFSTFEELIHQVILWFKSPWPWL